MNNQDELRKRAIQSIKDKRAFQLHFSVYIIFCFVFILADWFSGQPNSLTWAWWPILGWGSGVWLNWYGVYKHNNKNISETEIAEEMQKLK